MGEGVEARQAGYLGEGVASLPDKPGGTVQLVGLEEAAGILARQPFTL